LAVFPKEISLALPAGDFFDFACGKAVINCGKLGKPCGKGGECMGENRGKK
jgi:hypothetical protein